MTNVAVGILLKDGKYLICQRKKGGRYGLKWEFPGGKLESGESIKDCLKRELKEELEIEFSSIKKIITQQTYYEDGGMFNVAYCFVSDFTNEPQNKIFEQIKWVTYKELLKIDMLDGNKVFVNNLLKNKKNY